MKYDCDNFDDAFTTRKKLKNHEELKLERVKCECDSVMITTQNKLKDHGNLKHERVNYECDKCDDAFTT